MIPFNFKSSFSLYAVYDNSRIEIIFDWYWSDDMNQGIIKVGDCYHKYKIIIQYEHQTPHTRFPIKLTSTNFTKC